MRIKLLVVLSLSAVLFLVGCGKDNANVNANSNTAVVKSATPLPQTSQTAATDPALKTNIEAALKAKGFTGVTVDTSTTPATLRGTYPKGKLDEVIQTAQKANGEKPVKNEMTEAK